MTGTNDDRLSDLDIFVGEWSMAASFAPFPAGCEA
jgi:hypothetical protein